MFLKTYKRWTRASGRVGGGEVGTNIAGLEKRGGGGPWKY